MEIQSLYFIIKQSYHDDRQAALSQSTGNRNEKSYITEPSTSKKETIYSLWKNQI